jgi:glycosyltransferase involved in cell wall biosynthesis
MSDPLVSVIIPVKDGERFLAEAITSVLAQDYRPLEIIVVDGRSVDSSREIARSFELVRIVSQSEQGLADAWNVGIDDASGDFIAFLSHDDLWAPHKLKTQVSHMLEHPEIQYTIARVKFFAQPGLRTYPGFRSKLFEGDHIGRIPETLVAHSPLFDVVGRFDTSLSVSPDVDWFARAKDKNIPMAIIPDILLFKRVHDANLSLVGIDECHRDLLKTLRHSVVRQRQGSPREENEAEDAERSPGA